MAEVNPSRRRTMLFAGIAMLLPFIVIEFGARVVVAALATSPLPLIYGVDRDIGLQVRDLGDLDIEAFRDAGGFAGLPAAARQREKAADGGLVVWAFGGSTTAGYNCGSDASSWPEELAALAPGWTVINLGQDGSNSDFAYRTLLSELAQATPDLVLWANRVNETDILTLGADRNAERLALTFGAGGQSDGGALLWAQRLNLTLEEISVAYFMGSDLAARVAWKLGVEPPAQKVRTSANFDYAAMNYRFNSSDMLALAEQYGFGVGLITLANKAEVGDGPQDTAWDEIFIEAQTKLAIHPAARQIDTRDAPVLRRAGAGGGVLFCDGVHQTRLGNALTAEAVLGGLRSESDVAE